MELPSQELDHERSIPTRLLKGILETALNPGRAVKDFVTFDPHPDSMSSLKPGLISVIQEIRQERQNQQ